jgi:hypothetical protein
VNVIGSRAVVDDSAPLPVAAAELASLVEWLWLPPERAHSPVVVTAGRLPHTHRPVEVYAIAPNLQSPRYLLPVGHRLAVAAALATHLASPSATVRAIGTAVAGAWWTGAGELVVRDRLTVGVDRRVPDDKLAEWLLLRRVAEDLGHRDLVAVLPVRGSMPNAKPTARLIDHTGTALGFLKVGWSDATRGLVANETRVLRTLAGRVGDLGVPLVLSSGRFGDLAYLVTSPLPAVRPLADAPMTTPARLQAIAATGSVGEARLSDSQYLPALRGRLIAAAGAQPGAVTDLGACLSRLTAEPTVLRLGRWHGDWVPWNLGVTAAGPVAWDWEDSAPSAPLGFDLLHWHFERTLAPAGATLEQAADAVRRAAPELSTLGVPAAAHRMVVSLYLIEILTRASHLAAQDCGWDAKISRALPFGQTVLKLA